MKLLFAMIILFRLPLVSLPVHHGYPLPTSVMIIGEDDHLHLWTVAGYPGIIYCGNQSNMVGCTECPKHTITIDTAQSGREVAITLRHEAMHAVVNCSDKNPSPSWVSGLTEIHKAIYTLSEKMQSFEHYNPGYVHYVTQYY